MTSLAVFAVVRFSILTGILKPSSTHVFILRAKLALSLMSGVPCYFCRGYISELPTVSSIGALAFQLRLFLPVIPPVSDSGLNAFETTLVLPRCPTAVVRVFSKDRRSRGM